MHQTRRRKKRSSLGVRTVEISRGKNGFGFTISGQAPCILSCIVGGSPAEKAGLRPGDFLIAVNGLNVSKVLHDNVVRLIGNTNGILKLQIAENYYSDSSDEETAPNPRLKPKYPHRLRKNQAAACRAEKVVRDLQTGALFIDHLHIGTQPDGTTKPCLVIKQAGFNGEFRLSGRSNKAILDLIINQKCNFGSFLAPKHLEKLNLDQHPVVQCPPPCENEVYPEMDDMDDPTAVLRAVVGYLGTIEMPKDPQLPSSRLQAIRNCIRRLRIEKKIHTLVLLSVFPESVLLTNPHGLMLAEFPAEKITFSGVYADDKKFFGLVTSHGNSSDELSEGSEGPVSISSSCHVFLVDPKLQPHHVHLKRAKAFRITCTPHPTTNRCQEFPESADSILGAIVGLYRTRMGLSMDAAPGLAEFNAHVSPQPSNTSSNSSNSDSGIGFRDEGNTSDRVFVVDVDNYNRYRTNSLDRQSFPPRAPYCPGNLLPALSSSTVPENPAIDPGASTSAQPVDRLTVRAMPDPPPTPAPPAASSSRVGKVDRLSPKVYDVIGKSSTEKVEECDSDGSNADLSMLDTTLIPKDDQDAQLEQSFEATRKWARTSSLRRHLRRKRSIRRTTHEAGTMSDGELVSSVGHLSSCSSLLGLEHVSDTGSTVGSSCNSERPVDVGRVGSWAAGFNYLLDDVAGLHTFSEFLKKEFSQENILFWIACERYRKLQSQDDLNRTAKEIFSKHLSIGALEPVNVDSHARQIAAEGLNKPSAQIFVPAQKQIFNLMKFDCYQRFLKSQLFKECMMLEMQGHALPYNGKDLIDNADEESQVDANKVGLRGPKENELDERKRKSLLPWGRSKYKPTSDQTATKKVIERNSILRRSNKKKKKSKANEDARSDITGSRSSLASSEPSSNGIDLGRLTASRESLNSIDLSSFPGQCGGKGGCHLCRVILPDRSTTVVKTQSGESVAIMLQRLLERRGLTYTAVDAYMAGSERPVDQNLDVASLGCKEVRVEQRVLFRLDLPEDRTVGVKAKPGRVCGDALGPILMKYGLKLDNVFMRVAGSNRPVVYSTPVHTLDNHRIIVKLKEDFHGWDDDDNKAASLAQQQQETAYKFHTSEAPPIMDEVTNQIFELLLKGKSQHQIDELGIVDLDANNRLRNHLRCNSNMMRRNSTGGDKGLPGGMTEKSTKLLQQQAHRKCRQTDGQSAAGMARMSLLEALSVRAHSPPTRHVGKPDAHDLLEVWKRAQSSRLDDQRGTEINSELPDFLKVKKDKNTKLRGGGGIGSKKPPPHHRPDLDASALRYLDRSFTADGIIPSVLQAEEYFSNGYAYRPSLGLAASHRHADARLSPSVCMGGFRNLELRARSASCLPAPQNTARQIPQRPASNPLPHLMVPSRRSPAFPPYYALDNLLMSSMEGLDLDFDLDVTLKATSDLNESYGRRYSREAPPPLLPKVKRGPPPRPPSRQATPLMGQMPTDEGGFSRIGFVGVNNQDPQKRKVKITDGNRADRFNISFV